MDLRPCTPDIDPAGILDDVVVSENARRNARKRQSYSGGVYWQKHNPEAHACRCVRRMDKRLLAKHPEQYSLDKRCETCGRRVPTSAKIATCDRCREVVRCSTKEVI
jgi:hypothetical protein